MPAPLEILYEDNHLLAVNKPAGIATMGAAAGAASMHALAQDYLRQKYNKPGNVYVGVVSRLDSMVSGVLLLARTSKAAARLNQQFAGGTTKKTYLAAVEGVVRTESMTDTTPRILEDWVRKNDAAHRMEIAPAKAPGAQLAQLSWRVLAAARARTLLEIALLTGRKHQIRLQSSAQGHPVVGDVKYGGARHQHPGIALHSLRLTIEHPTQREPLTISAPLPSWWRVLGFAPDVLPAG